MPIAGVLILTQPELSDNALVKLNKMNKVTTYGIHKENYIIAVLEGNSISELETITNSITSKIPGVIGVYPSYVNYEEIETQESTE
ncbi:MAG: chaperone NapD [Candidatus Marinimicrobia bacterium]|nr:chaperone NapD [Candidatus Neomarinimicrobiota bacterium]